MTQKKRMDMADKMNVAQIYASDVFDDETMKQRLPKKIYAEFKNTLFGELDAISGWGERP